MHLRRRNGMRAVRTKTIAAAVLLAAVAPLTVSGTAMAADVSHSKDRLGQSAKSSQAAGVGTRDGEQVKDVPPGCKVWRDFHGLYYSSHYRCDVDASTQYRVFTLCEDPKTGTTRRVSGEWVNHRQTSSAQCWVPDVPVFDGWEYR